MRASMAYFAGAGTIVVAIAAGLGGGLTIASILSPHQQKLEQTKLEQRMSTKPIAPSAEADQAKVQAEAKPAVPYVAATGAAITANAPAPSQPEPQTQAAAPAPQSAPQPAEAKPANEPKVASDPPAKAAEPQTAKAQAAPREQQVAPREQAASDDSNAKARSPEDANATARDSDLKRLAAEKRKAQRRQQWADRKKAQQQRDAELRDVEANVRRDSDGPQIRDTDGPRLVVRQDDDDFASRRDLDRRGARGDRNPRVDSDRSDRPFGFPGFNLFGGGDRD